MDSMENQSLCYLYEWLVELDLKKEAVNLNRILKQQTPTTPKFVLYSCQTLNV